MSNSRKKRKLKGRKSSWKLYKQALQQQGRERAMLLLAKRLKQYLPPENSPENTGDETAKPLQ